MFELRLRGPLEEIVQGEQRKLLEKADALLNLGDTADSFKTLLACVAAGKDSDGDFREKVQTTLSRFHDYNIEDYMWHKLSVLERTPHALAELHGEINLHIGQFENGLKEKVLLLSLQRRKLVEIEYFYIGNP